MFFEDDEEQQLDADLEGEQFTVPSLRELCKRYLVTHLRDYESKPLLLPDIAVEELLKIAGSRVTPGFLRRLDDDREGDKSFRTILEPYWERLCKQQFRTSWETVLKSHNTWRRRYRHLEKDLKKRMKATERLAEKRKRQDEKSRQAKRVKSISMNSVRVPSAAQLQDGFMNPGVSYARSSQPRRQRTARPPEDRLGKVFRLAGKSSKLIRAKPTR
mmetsp:Transcript_10327/g.20308  ORF Transcript_10327/g.20308 Transcript_10327/m.20308 type:complete len:216 (+) Transcript_10327:159-806(+)